MHTQSQSFRDLVEAGMKYSAKQPSPDPEPELVESPADFLAAMVEAGEKYSNKLNTGGKPDYEKLTTEDKIKLCTRNNSANFGIAKMIDGSVRVTPRHCNHCKACYKANAEKLRGKVGAIAVRAEEETPNGQWRKKIVNEDTEASSLKKHIKRNQDGRHIEMACDAPGKSEVWAYIEDEPGKDMDEIYGEVSDLEAVDFDKLYALNRETGKKMSTGSGFRKSGSAPKKKDTERIVIPEILLKDNARNGEAENIMHRTNYIEEATTVEQAIRLYNYQFKFILKELEKANIEIAAIKLNFFNMAKEEILTGWNNNVKYWMSIYPPLLKDKGGNADNNPHLVYPKSSKPSEPVAN
jgi:hypothetical protein